MVKSRKTSFSIYVKWDRARESIVLMKIIGSVSVWWKETVKVKHSEMTFRKALLCFFISIEILYCWLWTYFTLYSSVPTVNFEKVNTGWEGEYLQNVITMIEFKKRLFQDNVGENNEGKFTYSSKTDFLSKMFQLRLFHCLPVLYSIVFIYIWFKTLEMESNSMHSIGFAESLKILSVKLIWRKPVLGP